MKLPDTCIYRVRGGWVKRLYGRDVGVPGGQRVRTLRAALRAMPGVQVVMPPLDKR